VITLNFPRHFAYLAIAAAVLIVAQSVPAPQWADGFTFYFSLVGFLHATALVSALCVSGAVAKRVLFIAITTALSANVPLVGGYAASSLQRDAGVGFLSLYAFSSAFGAAAYWMLIRLFWLRGLTKRSLVQAIALCVGATFASLLAFGLVTHQGKYESPLAQALPSIFWWFGFSASLWLFARGTATANNRFEHKGDE
jgi:hypothetical protein